MARSLARALAAVLAVGSVLTVTTVVRADEKTEVQKGYGYNFEDDLLQAGTIGGDVPILRVMQRGLRQRLMRPRTQFVTEMLRSVEKI